MAPPLKRHFIFCFLVEARGQLSPVVMLSGSGSTGEGTQEEVLIAAVVLLPGETYTYELFCAMCSALVWSNAVVSLSVYSPGERVMN